jgi:hypothetical protein
VNTRTAEGTSSDSPSNSGHHPGDDARNPEKVVDVMGVGGVLEPSNEEASKADAQTNLLGVGGVGVEGVESDSTVELPSADRKSDDSGFNTDKQIEEIPTKTFGDSDGTHKGITDPVTNETLEQQDQQDGKKAAGKVAYDDNTVEEHEQMGAPIAQGGTAVKGVQPVAETFGTRENVLEHKTTPSNNSGPTTTWTGTDGNGVLKQQDPVTKDLSTSDGVDDVGNGGYTSKTRMINAMRLAEAEVELGLLDRESKWNRIEELSGVDPVKVSTRLETLAQVKTAGVAKLAATKTATAFPRAFGKQTAAAHDFERIASEKQAKEPVNDALMDSALFS